MNRRVALVATIVLLTAGAERVRAFNPQPDPPGFGMVGLAAGQTARLSVVRVDNPDAIDNEDIRPVTLKLTFLDRDGHVILTRDGVRVESTVVLRPGRSAFLDLDSRGMVIEGGRASIRAFVQPARRPPGPRDSDPEWLPTLELYDNETGRASFVLQPGSDRYFKEVEPGQPQP